jgi:HSP20 family protein
MAIIRWDPFRDMVTLRDRMNRLFEEAFAGREEKGEMVSGSWYPSVDIHEKDKELVLTAELPGVDEKDIDIEIEGNTLTIKGEKEMEKETKEEDYHRIERSYGSFYRSFSLPPFVIPDKIKAEHNAGILRITIPKKAELKPKKVKVLKPGKSKSKKK